MLGQVLPPGVVKGGTALKLRVGEAGSRFTPDLDVARSSTVSLDEYLDALDENLAVGWSGFTGRIVTLEPAEPVGVPDDYVMQPFDLKVLYCGRSWLTARFELGHDEIGSTATPPLRIADDLAEMVEALGLDRPQPVPVLAVAHQVAQKLHACTSIGLGPVRTTGPMTSSICRSSTRMKRSIPTRSARPRSVVPTRRQPTSHRP